MEQVKIIILEDSEMAGIAPDNKTLLLNQDTQELYIGNGAEVPQRIVTETQPSYASLFMLMGT